MNKIRAQQEKVTSNAESELFAREQARREADEKRQADQRKQLHDDWQASLKAKEEKAKQRDITPDFWGSEVDDKEEELAIKKKQRDALRKAQEAQIKERQERDKREREEDQRGCDQWFLKPNDWE
jgi:hypothetical protein